MNRKPEPSQALLEVWPILRRYPWHFVLPAFAAAALVLTVSLFLPRKYSGEAIFERRTDMVLAEMTRKGAPTTFVDPRQALAEEVAGLPALEQLIDQLLAPHSSLRPRLLAQGLDRDNLRTELRKRVRVGSDIATAELDRVRVVFAGEDPVLIPAVVNGLVRNFIDRTRATNEARLKTTTEFFRNELARARKTADELEARKLAFEIAHRDVLPDTGTTPGSEIKGQLDALQRQYDETVARMQSLQAALDATPATQPAYTRIRNPEIETLSAKVREMQAQLDLMLGQLKMTDKHPDVQTLRERIAATQKQIETLPAEVTAQTQVSLNPKRGELEVLLATTTAQKQYLAEQIDKCRRDLGQTQGQADAIFPIRNAYQRLTRDAAEAQRQLTFWEDNLRRVQMAVTAETENRGIQLNFLQPCGTLGRPVSPNFFQVLSAAMLLSLIAGSVTVLLRYRTEDSFGSVEHLTRHAAVPLLGSISHIDTRGERRSRRFKRAVLYPLNLAGMALVLLVLAGMLYLSLQKPDVLERLKASARAVTPERLSLHTPTDALGRSE